MLDNDGGRFSIAPADGGARSSKQYYLENTNVLATEFELRSGERFRIVDFCPRFEQFGRMYRPISLFRIVEPLVGAPNIQVQCRPVQGWSKERAHAVRGNSHIRWDIRDESLRLTTNMPVTYLIDESSFVLKEKIYFALTWGLGVEEDLAQVSERFLGLTEQYWRVWVKHCSVPSQFQRETIRSALALKLHCYEDTGAILAALTTSLPEERDSGRNWDYRYCWLRDSYFVLSAFHNLGHFEEMEGFLQFLLEVAHKIDEPDGRLAPVYSLSRGLPLPETVHSNWSGFEGSQPVRSNNQAAEHIQNDVYGEMILTLAPIYFDERFIHLRSRSHEALLTNLARLCRDSLSQPDAGLWEIRNGWQRHTFTNLMCWAGLERAARIQEKGFLRKVDFSIKDACLHAQQVIVNEAFQGVLRNGPVDQSLDSALALAAVLRFPDEDLCRRTVLSIREELALGTKPTELSFFYRYSRNDDFGVPKSAFVICSFWVIQALARLNFKIEAREMLHDLLHAANHVGLLSEHYQPHSRHQLGNFPQAYSHVGLINAAFALSPPWSEVL